MDKSGTLDRRPDIERDVSDQCKDFLQVHERLYKLHVDHFHSLVPLLLR